MYVPHGIAHVVCDIGHVAIRGNIQLFSAFPSSIAKTKLTIGARKKNTTIRPMGSSPKIQYSLLSMTNTSMTARYIYSAFFSVLFIVFS